MANDDRTEQPTAKRRSEARKKGQVAKSADLNGGLVLAGGLVAIIATGPAIVGGAGAAMQTAFQQIAKPNEVTSGAGLHGLLMVVLHTMLTTVAPIAGICLAVGVLANVAQVGLRPRLGALTPDIKRINPVSGFKNVFGPRIFFESGKAIAKVAVVGAVVAMALIPDLTHLGASVGTTPGALGSLINDGIRGIAIRALAAYLLIGIVDFVWQRRRHEKSLMMSKQELREEHKSHALPPEVRSAIRRRQIQASRARMMAAVPKADVVVTNPTHFAVALQYDGEHPAPVVVAKGQDLVAAQIRRIASENNVPVVPDPPLARELHRSVEIGQMIPAELYAAVAQLLAFVYRMAARRKKAGLSS
jgi:flagellar biosynthetic protein FlhB